MRSSLCGVGGVRAAHSPEILSPPHSSAHTNETRGDPPAPPERTRLRETCSRPPPTDRLHVLGLCGGSPPPPSHKACRASCSLQCALLALGRGVMPEALRVVRAAVRYLSSSARWTRAGVSRVVHVGGASYRRFGTSARSGAATVGMAHGGGVERGSCLGWPHDAPAGVNQAAHTSATPAGPRGCELACDVSSVRGTPFLHASSPTHAGAAWLRRWPCRPWGWGGRREPAQ